MLNFSLMEVIIIIMGKLTSTLSFSLRTSADCVDVILLLITNIFKNNVAIFIKGNKGFTVVETCKWKKPKSKKLTETFSYS